MASVTEDPVPPVPNQQEILAPQQQGSNRVSVPWMQWFTQLREKVNILNASIINLSGITGNGLLVKNGAAWLLRTLQGTPDRISVSNGDGASGNPTVDVVTADLVSGSNVSFSGSGVGRIIDNGSGDLTINATGGGGGGGSQSALSAAILALTPKVYWLCNETSGTILADSSGNGMDLTLRGTNTLNYSEFIDGGSSFYSPTSATGLNGASRSDQSGIAVPTNYDWTVLGLFNWTRNTSGDCLPFSIFGNGETAATNVQVYVMFRYASGLVLFRSLWEYGNGSNEDISGPAIPVGNVFLYGYRKNTSSKKLDFIINGRVVYSTSYVNEPTGGTTAGTYVNGNPDSTALGDHNSSNIAFFDTALSNANLKTIAQAAGVW